MKILGYADRLSARPGDRVEFKVSCATPVYTAKLIRFAGAMLGPNPGQEIEIDADFAGDHPGREQSIPIGSYLQIDSWSNGIAGDGFTVQLWIRPSLIPCEHEQAIVACWDLERTSGFWLGIDRDGHLGFRIGNGTGPAAEVITDGPLVRGRWYGVLGWLDPERQELGLEVIALGRSWLPAETTKTTSPAANPPASVTGPLLMGASYLEPIGGGRVGPRDCFNGKIDRPRVWSRALTSDERSRLLTGADPEPVAPDLEAAWDFSFEMSGNRVVDTSSHGRHGVAVNRPMRGVTGANWTGSEVSFHNRPEEYGAIAFHEDDLADCGWDTDFDYVVPQDARPGVYAARLEAGGDHDYIPFYVRRPAGLPAASILYLAPTNTYLAYANEKLFRGLADAPDFLEKTTDHPTALTPQDEYLLSRPDLGASVYDLHPDGTGTCYSTRLRPMLTMRPDFRSWLTGFPRHFASDLFLIEWLEKFGFAYDVAIDEDLHVEGVNLLSPYSVVLTGSHPEYWTAPMLDGLESYLARGGRLMYLGGNGFYWVTGINRESPHIIEVRRGINGTRAWTSQPGEQYLSTTGEPGGLWRYRGRAPNRLVGVGFAAEGWSGGKGYRRLPASFDPRFAFIFDGVTKDGLIGDNGLIMGGASGDEIDRHDPLLGSPPEAVVLATSEGQHDDFYQLVVEDTTMTLPGHGGNDDPRVRSDLTYIESNNGGAAFSVGSINWIGSLMHNDGDNDVSRITRNVLRTFEQR